MAEAEAELEPRAARSVWSPDFWIRTAQMFGVPTFILLIMFFGLWKFGSWTAENIITPALQRHMKFLDESAATQSDVAKTIGKLNETSTKQTEILGKQTETLDKVYKALDHQAKFLEKIVKPPE